MKKIQLLFLFLFSVTSLFAQWEQVNNGLSSHTPSSMYTMTGFDAVWLGNAGGGVFKSLDNGDNWTNINGDLANLNVNEIRPFGTGTSMFVATEGGPFFTMNETSYTNCTSTGLTNTDIHYFWFGGDDPADYAIGTNGGGVFVGPDETGPWTAASNGLSGNGLIVNGMGGYSEGELDYAVAATDGGIYFSTDNMSTWTAENNGLSGDMLLVKKLTGLGKVVIIATRDGLFLNYEAEVNWISLVANEKFNTVLLTQISGSVYRVYAFGEKGFYSDDLMSYTPIDMTGISGGEVTCVAVNSTYIFVGTQDGVFRKKVSDLATTDLTAAFSATPTSGPVPLTVQFTDNSTVPGSKLNSLAKKILRNTALTKIATTWEWDFDNDGTVDSYDQNPSYTYNTPANYTVALKVGDGTNTDTETKTDFIKASQLSADFSADQTSGDPPLLIQFTDNSTASNTTITSWKWDFDNDGTVDSYNQHPSYTYQNAGNYTVSLTVGDGTSTDTETKTDYITVGQVTQITAAFSATPTSGLAPLSVQFTDNSTASNTNITSWAWDFDNDGTDDATTQNPSYTYQNAGNYSVSLTVGDGTNTDSETKTNYITVNQGVTQLTADFTATPTSGNAPLSVQFTDNSTAGDFTITSWIWDFDSDGNVDAAVRNPTYVFQNPGKYTVSLYVGDGTSTDSEVKTDFITVSQLSAGFSATPTSGFAPLTVQFTDNSVASNTTITSWSWDFYGDGTVDATTQNPSFTFQNAGTFTVSLLVSDGVTSVKHTETDYIKASVFNYPTEITVTTSYEYPTHSDIADFQSTDYRMFGVPGNSDAYLHDFLGSAHKEKWQAYFDNGAAQNFLIEYSQSDTFKLSTGKAFWLLHNGPININSNIIVSPLDASNNAAIPMQSGWNLVTNPFASPIYWLDIQTENSITDPIYGYNNGFTTSDSLLPYIGYYLYNTNSLQELKIPYYASLSNPLNKTVLEKDDFSLRINLLKQGQKVGEALLGLNKNAQKDFDEFDFRKPRAVGKIPDVQFYRPEWDENYSSFYSDIRGEFINKEEWNFQVVNSIFKELSLTFDMFSNYNFPDSTSITLVDWSNNRWINLKDLSRYDFIGNANPMNFSILIGPASEISAVISTIVPKEFSLSQNFPNPFNNETIITFSCPDQTQIEVIIFNALGQKVRSLFSGTVYSGKNTFKWDGRNDFGSVLSSGVYIFSLTTESNKRFSKKIILMK